MNHGNANHSEEDGLSTAMRLLIHYVGDIHQPLHATSKFDAAYPLGDRGGNSFKVLEKDGIKVQREKVGDVFVANRVKNSGAVLGVERSGTREACIQRWPSSARQRLDANARSRMVIDAEVFIRWRL